MDFSSTVAIIIALSIPTFVALIFFGIVLCKNNNPFGVLLLFISLNVFGLIISWALFYNLKKKQIKIEKNIILEKEKVANEEKKTLYDKLNYTIDKVNKYLDKKLKEKDKTP